MALVFEHQNLLDVAESITEAALARKESRGSHYRSDFPIRNDDEWLTNIFVYRENGSTKVRKEWINAECGWEDKPGDIRIRPWG